MLLVIEIAALLKLADKSQRHGVHTLADLASRIVLRQEYDCLMEK